MPSRLEMFEAWEVVLVKSMGESSIVSSMVVIFNVCL